MVGWVELSWDSFSRINRVFMTYFTVFTTYTAYRMDVLPNRLRNITAFVLYNMTCARDPGACKVGLVLS